MIKKPIFISYYTKDTIYQDAINKYLIPSLKKLNLDYHVYAIETLGDWKSNAIQKPLILKKALNEFPDNDIIWQDADSEILQDPSLLYNIPEDYDIALHYLNWSAQYGRPSDVGRSEMLDGTVLWRNTIKMRAFIDELIEKSTALKVDHQKTMSRMLETKESIKVFPLPRTYSYITSKPNGDKPAIEIKDPVIVHYQLSREGRKSLYDIK